MKTKREVIEWILFFPSVKVDSLKKKKERLDFLIFFFDIFGRILLLTIYVYYKGIIENLNVSQDVMIALIWLLVPAVLYLIYKHIKYTNLIKNDAMDYVIELIKEEEGLI